MEPASQVLGLTSPGRRVRGGWPGCDPSPVFLGASILYSICSLVFPELQLTAFMVDSHQGCSSNQRILSTNEYSLADWARDPIRGVR